MATTGHCGETFCSCFSTGDCTDGLPMPEPQVLSAGEQFVGCAGLVRNWLSNGAGGGFEDRSARSLHAAVAATTAITATKFVSFICQPPN
jgi:hypothetical protein